MGCSFFALAGVNKQDQCEVMGDEQKAASNVVHVDFVRRRRMEAPGEEIPWGNLEAELDEAWRQVHLPLPEPELVADVFSMTEVTRLTGLSTARLRRLDREGIVVPSSEVGGRRTYTFRDLVILRAVQGLLAHGVKLRKVIDSVQALRSRLPKAVRSLAELRIASDGHRVVVHGPGAPFEPLTGQLLLDFKVRQLRDDVVRLLRPRCEVERKRVAFQLYRRACELDEDPACVEEACELYQRALAYDPTLALAYNNLGNLRYRQGNEDAAIDLYHRALDIDPAQPEALYNLGFCLLHRGNAASAIPFLEAAAESNPRFADAQLCLAMAHELTGDRRGARPAWRRYLELEPSGEWADYARQHL
ncbi:MAG: tetratricopeptide repeat protein [Myxococcales bacterium]|nr:tetratricopeptide repeat protein [Polyangiaceae bacterium]MDW8250272.1 tetratricopeptide repeat protein [Myxococcales bacterium]